MQNSTLKNIRIVLFGIVFLALLAQVYFAFLHPKSNGDIGPQLGSGDYTLDVTDGTQFTQNSLKGKPSAVFFGFTHCPDVCPTTLGDIMIWQEELGDKADDLQIYFITVDPERDTLDILDGYVTWLDGAQGVTGTRTEIDKAISAFRIYSRKVPLGDEGDYNMDHSAHVLLFDENARFFEPINYQEDLDVALEKLNRLLDS